MSSKNEELIEMAKEWAGKYSPMGCIGTAVRGYIAGYQAFAERKDREEADEEACQKEEKR